MPKPGTLKDELTPQQEAFALAYAESGNAAASYRSAYGQDENARDGWIYVEASQMLDHPKVSLRIQELQAEAAKMALYSVRAAYEELEEARKRAEALKQPATEVSAIAAKIKLFGLDKPTKIDHTTDGKPLPARLDVSGLSLEALAEIMAAQDASES